MALLRVFAWASILEGSLSVVTAVVAVPRRVQCRMLKGAQGEDKQVQLKSRGQIDSNKEIKGLKVMVKLRISKLIVG